MKIEVKSEDSEIEIPVKVYKALSLPIIYLNKRINNAFKQAEIERVEPSWTWDD